MSGRTEVLDSVVDPTPEEDALEPVRVGALVRTFVLALLLFGGAVALTTIKLPYLVLEPGLTFETESFVSVEGTELYPNPESEVRFVTVTQRRVSTFGWVISKLQDSDRIFHEDELLQGRTFDEQRAENAQLMLSSQNDAIVAALAQLGFDVAEPAGVVVIDVVDGGALDGLVDLNDVITQVNGEPVATFEELYDLVDFTPIDEKVDFLVGRPGEAAALVEVSLTGDTAAFVGIVRGSDSPDGGAAIADVVEGGPVADLLLGGDRITNVNGSTIGTFEDLLNVLGGLRSGDEVGIEAIRPGDDDVAEETIVGTVVLGSRVLERAGLANAATQFRDAELPFEVEILTEDVGGPSAGLAFTLTVLDVLTEGDLVGDQEIVVTGTMSRDGRIGPIGGVHQKAFAARDAGVDIFIVPTANLEEARAAVDDLRIEPADTLADALAILADLGGNALDIPDDGEL